jgi:hypothetical protein
MLTPEEEKFFTFWEENRERLSGVRQQVLMGIPYGLLFSLPIVLNFLAGRFWYKRADAVGRSQFNPLVMVLAVLVITSFIAVFYKRFKWEQAEQRYLELKARKDRMARDASG